MAIVILPNDKSEPDKRRVFIFPKTFSDLHFYRSKPGTKTLDIRIAQIDKIDGFLAKYKDNYVLSASGIDKSN
jgi:hypothetical protein